MRCITILLFFIVGMVMVSCCDSGEDTGYVLADNSSKKSFYSTTNVPDGYGIGVVNDNDGNVYFVADDNNDGTGNVNRVNFVLNNGGEAAGNNGAQANGCCLFYDQKARSVTINGVTYTFHQNDDNKIDVAITCNNISELYTNVVDASLLNSGAGNNKIGNAFMGIYNAADIIEATNARVKNDSPLFPYVASVSDYISLLRGDSQWLGNDANVGQLTANPGDKAVNVDFTIVTETDNVAYNNTNSGNGAIASGKGALKVTLTWFFDSDIDLHVFEPDYETSVGHIFFGAPTNSFCGGYLDIDNVRGYYINPLTGETNTGLAAVENIYWMDSPKDGVYKICLDNYSHIRAGMCNLAIYKDGKSIYSKNVWINTNDRVRYIVSVCMPYGDVIEDASVTRGESGIDYISLPKKDYSSFKIFQ